MDNGNHYHKCDLQIHSPRDINWKGGDCISDEERKNYAKKFIEQCREAELDAVAITDHHDLVFYEYIKKAADTEEDDEGNLKPVEQRIVVFPGIELTLHNPPIQGILILDATFPQSLFVTVLGCLSIAQAHKQDGSTAEVEPIPSSNISGINDIYTKLDGTNGVKGRYIFLPHVSRKGHKTIMREGFHESYANMNACGGYTDGLFDDPNVGYRNKLNGKSKEWGYKSLAVLQTSDFRGSGELKDTGVATWVKWKEPTGEALRQACLAKESRISLVEPEIPNIYIEKIDVTNSAFLSKFELDFNPQLNSIIGGRGTGKSSILEYLRWALCDQTNSFGSDEIASEIERKRSTLIQKTLREVNGEVRVYFSVNGTRHVVKRNPKTEDVLLKIADGDFENVRPDFIRNLLPIQAYSQKQLSSVSISTGELKRFIEQPIAKELDAIESQLTEVKKRIRESYYNLLEYKKTKFEISKIKLEKSSLDKQITELQKSLKGITAEDRAIIARANLYVNENSRFKEVVLEYQELSEVLESAERSVTNYEDLEIPEVEIENKTVIESLENERKQLLVELSKGIKSLTHLRESSEEKIVKFRDDWMEKRNAFKVEYTGVKEKSTSSKQTLQNIKELEVKLEQLDQSIKERNSALHRINADEDNFEEIYLEYIDLQNARLKTVKSSIEGFTALSDGYIRANYENSINTERLLEDVKSIFSGRRMNIKSAKIETLMGLVAASENPIERWSDLVKEFKQLSEFNLSPIALEELPSTPMLSEANFTEQNKRKITEMIDDDSFILLASISPEFQPVFLYRTNNVMEDEVPFEDASAGQQATALINVLLNQEGFPLVIDQPEDDIDNRAIEKIIEKLWESKKKRQLIFTSHNANIVVNGDSELVVCCDYNESSTKTMGTVKHEGSIDEKAIRNEITSVMEGGEKAFKLRKEKYGF